jgi:hypothetical protein
VKLAEAAVVQVLGADWRNARCGRRNVRTVRADPEIKFLSLLCSRMWTWDGWALLGGPGHPWSGKVRQRKCRGEGAAVRGPVHPLVLRREYSYLVGVSARSQVCNGIPIDGCEVVKDLPGH